MCPLFSSNLFFFTKWEPFKNYEKCLLFHLKSSFRSRDIQFFVFLSFTLSSPVDHFFRGWSKINLKVHDVINCLYKNSITYFVWYLEKEKRYDIETLSIDRGSDKEHFYRKMMQKMYKKRIAPDLFTTLVNNPKQSLHARNSFKRKISKKKS